VQTQILLEDLEFYKYTQMEAYDITKVTAELKSDNVQCSTVIKYITLLFVFVGVDYYRKHCHYIL